MKRVVILLFLLLVINIASAEPILEIQNQDQGFQPGETLLAKISLQEGEQFFTTITLADIEFLEGRKKTFFEYDIVLYDNTHYLYAYLTRTGNFTLKINNILYKQAEELKQKTLTQDLEIKKNILNETNITTTKILSIKPGFKFTSTQPEFILKNTGDSELNIDYNSQQISLQPTQIKTIQNTPQQTFSYLTISTYKEFKIPIIYIPLSIPTTQNTTQTFLKSEPSYLHVNLIKDQQPPENTQEITLFNFAEDNLTNIMISSDIEVLEIQNQNLSDIQAKSETPLTLNFNTNTEKNFLQGSIILKYTQQQSEQELTIPIYVYIASNESSQTQTSEESCEDLSGKICDYSTESCSETPIYASGLPCCLGTCNKIKSDDKKSYGWVIGILIFVVLAIIGFLIFRKIRKTKQKTPEQHLQEKTQKFEIDTKTNKTKGNLTK